MLFLDSSPLLPPWLVTPPTCTKIMLAISVCQKLCYAKEIWNNCRHLFNLKSRTPAKKSQFSRQAISISCLCHNCLIPLNAREKNSTYLAISKYKTTLPKCRLLADFLYGEVRVQTLLPPCRGKNAWRAQE